MVVVDHTSADPLVDSGGGSGDGEACVTFVHVHSESQKGVARYQLPVISCQLPAISCQQVRVHAMARAGLLLDNKETIGHHAHFVLQHWMQYFHHGL